MEMMILPIVDLKQIDCQIFLQPRRICSDHQRIVVWGLQPWGATCKSLKGKEEHFYRGEGGTEIGRTEVNRVHSFSIGWVLARQGEQCFLFLLASAIVTGQERAPILSPNSISLRFLFINIFILFHRVDMGTESYKSHKSLSTVPGTSWIFWNH